MSARDLPLSELLAHAAGNSASIDPRACVEPGALIGEGATLKSGVFVAAGTRLGRGVHVAANAVFVAAEGVEAGTIVEDGVQVGANAVVHANLLIGSRARIRPGAVVTSSVPAGAIVEGHPAVITGHVDAVSTPAAAVHAPQWRPEGPTLQGAVATAVRGVTVHRMPARADLNGERVEASFVDEVPFAPQHCALVFGTARSDVRSEGAQRSADQFLVCARGRCSVIVDDGTQQLEIVLDDPQRGLYVPALTWTTRHRHSADAVVLLFSSEHPEAAAAIVGYDTFRAAVGAAH